MNKLQIFTILIFFLITSGCTDKNKNKINGFKIISLAPSLTEVIFYLGSGNDLQGVSSSCTYPQEASDITSVASVTDINLELVSVIDPDIVFLLPSQSSFETKLSAMGIKTVTVPQRDLAEISSSFSIIGSYLKKKERGEQIKDSLNDLVKKIQLPSSGKKVLVSCSREYGSGVKSIYSTGGTGFLNDIIKIAGLENCLDSDVPYPKINAETIMALDPDYIFDLVPGNIGLSKEQLYDDWKFYRNINAFKTGNIHIFKGDYTTIPGPRIFDLIEDVIQKISK